MNSSFDLKNLMKLNLKTGLITAGLIGLSAICFNNYLTRGVCKIVKDLTGQVIIITGANTGIGKETARALAKMGATIVMACRDEKRTLPVIEELKTDTKNNNIEFIQCELGDLKSIHEFAKEFKRRHQRLDMLINNAGLGAIPERLETKDGFESIFGCNHLGHFYLTLQLLDVLEKTPQSRVINVSSLIHKGVDMTWDDLMLQKKYAPLYAYRQSKLANVLFTKELQKRLNESNVKVVALHPGTVATEINRYSTMTWSHTIIFKGIMDPLVKIFGKSRMQGAQTTLKCALEDFDKLQAGGYYSDCKLEDASPEALNEENGKRLWEVSSKLIEEKTRNF